MRRTFQVLLASISMLLIFLTPPAPASGLQDGIEEAASQISGPAPVSTSEDGSYLVDANGEPFLWMADTAWDLTHRLTREEIDAYLDDRQQKGFTVILFRLPFRDWDDEPQHGNPYGQRPFFDNDISQPNEAYFELVDYALDEMEMRGMVAGLLPLWGFVLGADSGYDVSDEDIITYANWLGERYKHRQNIVWVSGGDTGQNPKWALLGSELKKADPSKLVTFHPSRANVSSYHLFGDADWLDFHMIQTGHSPDLDSNYLAIEEIYRDSSKPVLNGEPPYEDIAVGDGVRISPHQVRKAAYWSLLAGGFGHTYGHVEIFQFARAMEGQPDTWGANNVWTEALGAPGAQQMTYLLEQLRSVPWERFQPNQDLVVSDNPSGPDHLRAAAQSAGTMAWIYFPEQREAEIDLSQLVGMLEARWFDPATGEVLEAGRFEAAGTQTFSSPFAEDALLMLAPAAQAERLLDNPLVRIGIIVLGSLLVLVLLILVFWQIRSGIG